jgi:cardiolipin synthase A/B
MNDLWDVVAKLAIDLSPARVESAATAIAKLNDATEVEKARASFGPNLSKQFWNRFRESWLANPNVEPSEVCAGLRTGSRVGQAKENIQTVDLVWTGPVGLVPVRSTEQVMLELIHAAQNSLFLVSYVNVGARTIVTALNQAVDRGVKIQMLMEESKEAAEKIKNSVPSAQVYIWSKAAKVAYAGREGVSVHAKCVVSDGKEALITSANLTDYALEKNMELGVHIIGGREPRLLLDHLRTLLRTRVATPFEHKM